MKAGGLCESWWGVFACVQSVLQIQSIVGVDPDPALYVDVGLDPSLHVDVEPDPSLHVDAELDPTLDVEVETNPVLYTLMWSWILL